MIRENITVIQCRVPLEYDIVPACNYKNIFADIIKVYFIINVLNLKC